MVTRRPDRLDARLMHVMAMRAQRLPVLTVPEQNRIPPVRYPVIDNRRQPGATVAQRHAPRIYGEERGALFSPSVVVPPLMRSSSCHSMSAWCRALQDSHATWRALLLFTKSRTLRDSRIFGGMHGTRSAALG